MKNHKLIDKLSLDKTEFDKFIVTSIADRKKDFYSQAYAGHQFGHFTILGDGRATLLGEHINRENKRFDIQLKGSGKTPYSRNGDGKGTLKSMLRLIFRITTNIFSKTKPNKFNNLFLKTL